MMDDILGGLGIIAVGVTYWLLRSRMMAYEGWIRRSIFQSKKEHRPGRIRFWWDLIGTLIWCGIGLAIVVNGIGSMLAS